MKENKSNINTVTLAMLVVWAIFFYITKGESYATKTYYLLIGGVMHVIFTTIIVITDKIIDWRDRQSKEDH